MLKYNSSFIELETLRTLEPYYSEDPWTKFLANKKVLVISSKTSSIRKQYDKRNLIWTNNLLPEFKELITLEFPECYYRVDESKRISEVYQNNTHELLKKYEERINDIDFDILLSGAGVYGLPLAAYAKKINKIGIHLGGAIQILFGIKGHRWDNHNVISTFFNEHWITPSEEEIPKYYKTWEGGAYF